MKIKPTTLKVGQRVQLATSILERDSIMADCLTDGSGKPLIGVVRSIDETKPMPIEVWFDEDGEFMHGGWWYFEFSEELEVVNE